MSLPATDRAHFDEADNSTQKHTIPMRAWIVVAGSAALATAGLTTYVVTGSWLEKAFGVSTSGVGAIVMGLGIFELVASSSSAAFADRIGKFRSTLAAELLLILGLMIMVLADDQLWIGVVGLLVFLLGFEYAIVTSFSLLSEAMPEARGRILSVGHATTSNVTVPGTVTLASGRRRVLRGRRRGISRRWPR